MKIENSRGISKKQLPIVANRLVGSAVTRERGEERGDVKAPAGTSFPLTMLLLRAASLSSACYTLGRPPC